MNEYNERTLKNVLEDYREEQDKEFLKEIEEAKNDPLYQISEGEAEAFAKKHIKTKKKKTTKILIRVASILLVLAIGLSIIPITVEGRKSTIAEIIVNYINSEFLAFDSNENDDLLLSYEGKYIPTWIPDGYKVESVTNLKDRKQITFVNSKGNVITVEEQPSELKTNIDSEKYDSIEQVEINGHNSIYVKNKERHRVMITTEDSILYIASDDMGIDLIGFAKKIEKR